MGGRGGGWVPPRGFSWRLPRRFLLRSGLLAALFPIFERVPRLGPAAHAQAPNGEGNLEWRHGLSLFGELGYPATFNQFPYGNPHASKGASVRLMAIGTLDNF